MVKLVPAVLAVISTDAPNTPAVVCLVKNIIELAVTLVVETVTVPAINVATPAVLFVPVLMHTNLCTTSS